MQTPMAEKFNFRTNVEINERTGEVMAVYFQIRKGKVARVKEYAAGNVFGDYDRKGTLLGIEL